MIDCDFIFIVDMLISCVYDVSSSIVIFKDIYYVDCDFMDLNLVVIGENHLADPIYLIGPMHSELIENLFRLACPRVYPAPLA